MPTFAAAAGIEPPRQAQGKDILSGFRREAALSEYGVPGTPYNDRKLIADGLHGRRFSNPGDVRLPWEGNPVSLAGRFRMLRTERWKYVHEPGGTDELYDLEQDPDEQRNLAAERPQAAAAMRERSGECGAGDSPTSRSIARPLSVPRMTTSRSLAWPLIPGPGPRPGSGPDPGGG